MGLTMVRRIVEMYGGSIRVESDGAGRGCCFRFTLPEALAGLP
jgi:signal transduction histidine kinase